MIFPASRAASGLLDIEICCLMKPGVAMRYGTLTASSYKPIFDGRVRHSKKEACRVAKDFAGAKGDAFAYFEQSKCDLQLCGG